MLANDPHMATHVPSIWYLAHVSAGAVEIVGADVQDLDREKLDASGRFADFLGVQKRMTVIPETVRVKGAAPVVVNVRITRHGPLISDAINANSAASPTPPTSPLLEPDRLTISAYMRLNRARHRDDVTTALTAQVAPSQNFVCTDVNGHIGYDAPGHIPLRTSSDGSQSTDGWVPFVELPHACDPPQPVIVTANNRRSGALGAPLVGLEDPNRYRAMRPDRLNRPPAPHPGPVVTKVHLKVRGDDTPRCVRSPG